MRTRISKQRLADFRRSNAVYSISCHQQCDCAKYGPTCRRGFFSLWIQAVYGSYFSARLGVPAEVNFGDRPYLYTDAAAFVGEKNFWNYYYQQDQLSTTGTVVPSILVEDYPLRIWHRKHAKVVWETTVRNLKLQPSVNRYIDKLTSSFGKYQTLGVHIRGTDHSNEVPPIPMDRYFNILDKLLPNYQKLFVSTDQQDSLVRLIDRYGDQVQYQKATRSINSIAVHTNLEENKRYHLGLEVLADAYALSRCARAILVHSNVSYAAYLLSPGLDYILLENPSSRVSRYHTLLVYLLDRWGIRKM